MAFTGSSSSWKSCEGWVMQWVTGLFWRSPNLPHKLKKKKVMLLFPARSADYIFSPTEKYTATLKRVKKSHGPYQKKKKKILGSQDPYRPPTVPLTLSRPLTIVALKLEIFHRRFIEKLKSKDYLKMTHLFKSNFAMLFRPGFTAIFSGSSLMPSCSSYPLT